MRSITLTGLAALAAVLAAPPWARAQEVVLDLWTIDDPGEYHYVLAEEYMALHPEVQINLRTVQFRDMVNDLARAIAAGNAPDITYIDNPEVALFASRGLLLDLRPMIEQSEVIRLDDIYPGPLASVSYRGASMASPGAPTRSRSTTMPTCSGPPVSIRTIRPGHGTNSMRRRRS
ncbi:ABC-type sugar transport system, periplasmic component [Rubellimicrobium thermophilum DSM 16684]|uniref:ABC-type sugar transport system, periplasmic component n=1 Tax=Rubellimicrobium thermophilum DSM 16684 TaxID=1123069 RepID=S9SMS9_9RHOB|nr:ABC-type sugar transport system, periplasmic component [Rubellimicrobium thermophilum DSM 16684]